MSEQPASGVPHPDVPDADFDLGELFLAGVFGILFTLLIVAEIAWRLGAIFWM